MRARIGALILSLIVSGLGLFGVLVLLGTSGLSPARAQTDPAIIRVAPSGEDGPGCGEDVAPCQTIQYAVDIAADGDEIWIAALDVGAGITLTTRYVGAGDSVITLDKSLTLRGGYVYVHWGAFALWDLRSIPALVDGENARRVLSVIGDVAPTLQFLTLMNGNAERGGNIYAEDATLTFIATSIVSGSAAYGGGLYLKDCHAAFDLTEIDPMPYTVGLTLLTDLSGLVLIRDNVATADGGGVYVEGGDPIFAGSLIQANHAGGRGGGVFVEESALRVAASSVLSNTASQGGGLYFDGPLTLLLNKTPMLLNTYVRYNQALDADEGRHGDGGGLYMRSAVVDLLNVVIADNRAVDGAAMYMYASSPQIFFNTIAQNRGDNGVYVTHQPAVLWPPSPLVPSFPNITNTIIASHTVGIYVDSTELLFPLENRATLAGTLWWGNGRDVQGAGDIRQSHDVVGSPAFICTGMFPMCPLPYHISTAAGASAAVDQGVEIGWPLSALGFLMDIDGQLRPSGVAYDIGADEVPNDARTLAIVPGLSMRVAQPGRTVTHTHWLVNTAPETASLQLYDVIAHSDRGWEVDVTPDAVRVGGQSTATVHVYVTVPTDVITNGVTDQTLLTVTSHADSQQQASARDFTTVISATDIDMGVIKEANVTQINPGEGIRYTLTMTVTGALQENVRVTLTDIMRPVRAVADWTLPDQCPDSDPASGIITCALVVPKGTSHLPYRLGFDVTTRDTYTGGLLFNRVTLSADVSERNMLNNASQATVVVMDTMTPLYLPLIVRH
jgi:hypothetical protein